MAIAHRYWPVIALVAVAIAGFFTVNFGAGLASLCAIAIGVPTLAALRAPAATRHVIFAWMTLAIVSVAIYLILAYVYAAAYILAAVVKTPGWLVGLGIAIEYCGLGAAAYFAMAHVRTSAAPNTPLRIPAIALSILSASAPIAIVFALRDPGLGTSVVFYSQPAAALILVAAGALLSLGFWAGAQLVQPASLAASRKISMALKAVVGIACVLPLAYTALSVSAFIHGGVNSTEAVRYVAYKATLEPAAGGSDTFVLREQYKRLAGKTVTPVLRVREVRGLPDGFLVRKVSFAPLPGDYSHVTADISVNDLPRGSFYEADFTRSPGDASDKLVTPFDRTESAHWTMTTSFANGISFTYTPPLPAPIRNMLSPFIGLASYGAWAVAIGSFLFATLAGKVWDAVVDRFVDWFKSLFARRKRAQPA